MAMQVANLIPHAPALTAWPLVAVARVAMAVAVAVATAVVTEAVVEAVVAPSAAEQQQCS